MKAIIRKLEESDKKQIESVVPGIIGQIPGMNQSRLQMGNRLIVERFPRAVRIPSFIYLGGFSPELILVGFATGVLPEYTPNAELSLLGVLPDFQYKGFAAGLFMEFVRLASEAGKTGIECSISATNARTIALASGIGFKLQEEHLSHLYNCTIGTWIAPVDAIRESIQN